MRSRLTANIIKSIMFVSSYFPLYIMLLILYWNYYKDILENPDKSKVAFLSILFICLSISLFSIIMIKKGSSTRCLKVGKVSRPDDVMISYIMTYIIPLLSISLEDKATLIVNFILFILVGYLYIRLNLIYLNPLWAIFGFINYRNEDEIVIITDITYDQLKKKDTIEGTYLLNGIFIAKKKNNT